MCTTSGEEERKGACKKRGIVYETFCINCGSDGEGEIEGKRNNIQKRKKKKKYKYKYIGETSRSGYERGGEHMDDKRNFNEKSHMLKHCLIAHKDEDPADVKFGMRMRSQYKTALERQIGEAIAILEEKENMVELLNSKSEYNRCSLPRISAGDTKEWLEKLQEEETAEKQVKANIRCLKKQKNRKKKEKEKK